jgi:hypothetical protein
MSKSKRIFCVEDTKEFTPKFLKMEHRRYVKGLTRLGHDVQVFGYRNAFYYAGPILSARFMRDWCKTHRVDELLATQIKSYNPDIVIVRFAGYLDTQTISVMRQAAPNAFIVGMDTDPWPEFQGCRLQMGAKVDLMITNYEGRWMDSYRQAGARCAFIAFNCDPDIEHPYDVGSQWQSDILFTGHEKLSRKYPTEELRYQLVSKMTKMPNCTLYGCCGRPRIGGIEYLYAISGTKIGLSVNAVNDIRLYHSDRPTTYLSCGAFVLSKRVPDTDLLFKDGVHMKYFDTAEEFFDLAEWYIKHDDERKKIADAGMKHVHAEFNCVKMAGYVMDLIEKGSYSASWGNYTAS